MSVLSSFPAGGGVKLKATAYAAAANLPATDKEGALAIITSASIGKVFGTAEEPTPEASGDLWVWLGGYSTAPLVLSDLLTLHPRSCYQYNGASWDFVESYVYTGGAWVELSLMLYDYGEEVYSAIQQYGPGGAGADGTRQYVTKYSGYLTLRLSTSLSYANVRAGVVTAVDLTDVDTIQITSAVSNSATQRLQIAGTAGGETAVASVSLGTGTYNLDVSSFSGQYYVVVYGFVPNYWESTTVITVYRIKLIKS